MYSKVLDFTNDVSISTSEISPTPYSIENNQIKIPLNQNIDSKTFVMGLNSNLQSDFASMQTLEFVFDFNWTTDLSDHAVNFQITRLFGSTDSEFQCYFDLSDNLFKTSNIDDNGYVITDGKDIDVGTSKNIEIALKYSITSGNSMLTEVSVNNELKDSYETTFKDNFTNTDLNFSAMLYSSTPTTLTVNDYALIKKIEYTTKNVVPEPSTYAMIFGILAFVCAFRHKRK